MSRARVALALVVLWTAITGCAGIRLLPGHFGDFQIQEPVPAATVNAVGESCAATAEADGRIPTGYRRMPTAIANCTDHPPENLLDYTLWDGIDTSAQPGYDTSWTCWRLQTSFRDAARRLAGLSALFGDGRNLPAIRAAVVDHMEEAAALYYWNDGGNFDDAPINGLTPAHADAMADLAVSGRIAYYVFRGTQPVEESGEPTGSPVTVAGVRETIAAQNPAHSIDEAAIERAITSALDRAYTTLWAIRGPIEERRRLRSALGYIAVAADEDPPHRPLNVFAPSFSPAPPPADGASPLPDLDVHQQNALVGVPVERTDWSLPPGDRDRGRRVTTYVPVDTRYLVIVDAAEELPARRDPDARFDGRNLPPHDTVVLPEDYDVVLLLHGHSSRAEEAMDLARPLIQEWKGGSRRLAVIAMDLPSNGYSQMIYHRQVANVDSDGGTRISEFTWHDGSFTAYYPTLDFIEEFVVSFVDQLAHADYPQLPEQIKAVVGGSLGGNLGLRLSRRQRDSESALPFLRHIVSWSPASTWGDSWARARWCSPIGIDCLVTLSESGTYADVAKHESVRVTRDKYRAYDDGVVSPHGVVERGARKLEYFVDVFTNSGEFFQALLSNEFPPQGDRWYRDGWPCKKTYLKSAILDRWEIYNKTYRLWHWRVAHEQLIFMHNEPYLSRSTLGGGAIGADRSYALFSSHVLLAAGSEDNGAPDRLYDNTRQLAVAAETLHRDRPQPRLTGHTLWLENTGHSIHNERPNLLAQRIWLFLEHLR